MRVPYKRIDKKLDLIDKKLDIMKSQLNTEFKRIKIRMIESRSNSIEFAMLSVGSLSLAVFVTNKIWIFLYMAFITYVSGMLLQIYTNFKIRKMKIR